MRYNLFELDEHGNWEHRVAGIGVVLGDHIRFAVLAAKDASVIYFVAR